MGLTRETIALIRELRNAGVTRARFDDMEFEISHADPVVIQATGTDREQSPDDEDLLYHSADGPPEPQATAEDDE